jgi:glycosyltransferase involved in cell wall biosynthesis
MERSNERLLIVQLAPPWFAIPPSAYGGIELVINDLTTGLAALGHDVSLIAPGDSCTTARLVPNVPRHLGLDYPLAVKARMMAETSARSYREARLRLHADVLHDHTDERPDPAYPVPIVRTAHGPATPEAVRKYVDFSRRGDAFVAISHRQRELFDRRCAALYGPAVAINWVGTIHNPLDVAAIPFSAHKEDFAFFLGRCDWEKNPDGAIRVARAAGIPLVMALRIHQGERAYFEEAVWPLLGPDVTLLPEVGSPEKFEWLRRAKVVIFPSQWEEPFGLVMTEALACGTPVVALDRGAAPEVLTDGVTGFLRNSEAGLAEAIREVGSLDPYACRRYIEVCFNPRRIAGQYVEAYRRAITQHGAAPMRGVSVDDRPGGLGHPAARAAYAPDGGPS